jgi:tetratricopeptide (TPR) repeat protein
MKNKTSRAILAAFLLCAGTTLFASPSAEAAKLSQSLGPKIVEAQKALQSKDYQGAMTQLKTLKGEATADFDIYIINRLIMAAAVSLNDMATANAAIDAAAASPAMPDSDKKDIFYNALLLACNTQQWPQAIKYGEQLAQLNGLDVQTSGLLAIAYYNTNDFAHAQQYAQQNIQLAKASGQQPNPASTQIILNAQVKQNNQAGAQQTLEQMVVQTNSPQAWAQLIGTSFGVSGTSETQALYLYRLSMLVGTMTSLYYQEMANLLGLLGYPTEAENVLQQGISSGKISAADVAATLAKARRDAAVDQSSLSQIAASAERSRMGEQEVKLGEDYWGYGRYADAETAARAAMAKGGLKTPWEGLMLLGATEVAQGKYADAIQTLSQVSGTPAVMRTAHLWSLYAQAKQGPAPATAAAAPAQAPSQSPSH